MTQNASNTQSTPYNICNAGDSTNYNLLCQSDDFCQAIPHQSYQSELPQRAYQYTNEKVVYKIDDDPAPEINKENLDMENFYFTNKGNEKLQINFVGIKSMCDCCSASFQSCSTLHRYIKSRCIALEKVAIAETDLNSPSARPILCSMAKLSASGSDLLFRGWNYTTTLITFNPMILPAISDHDTSVCLNTDCGVTLVDKT